MDTSENLAFENSESQLLPSTPELREYYICQAGAVYGPADMRNIAIWIGEGRVTSRDWVFVPDNAEWKPILHFPDLIGCFFNSLEKPTYPPSGIPLHVTLKYFRNSEEAAKKGVNTVKLEQRMFVRLPLTATMTYSRVTDINPELSQKHATISLDISEGGIAFETTEELSVGDIVQVDLDFYPENINTTARVIHCNLGDSGVYTIGVSFRNLPALEVERIRQFVRSSLHTASRNAPPAQVDKEEHESNRGSMGTS